MKHGHRFLIGALVAVALAAALALIAAGGRVRWRRRASSMSTPTQRGANDGTSWDDAYTDSANCPGCSRIGGRDLGGGGDLQAHENGTDRYASFQMMNGVAIYGGFDPARAPSGSRTATG